MKSRVTYFKCKVRIELPEVLRYLQYKKKETETPPWLGEIIQSQIDAAGPLIDPWGIYSVFPNVSFREHEVLRDAQEIAFGICSIGQDLEEAAAGCFRKKEYLEGLVLDAIGTAAAENLAELIRLEIKGKASNAGLHISGRFSPGYNDWNLDGQRLIFGHFSGEPLRVTINESFMMTPRKSLSFAYKLGVQTCEDSDAGNCRYCTFAPRCAFRKDDPDNTCTSGTCPAR